MRWLIFRMIVQKRRRSMVNKVLWGLMLGVVFILAYGTWLEVMSP